MSKYFYKDSEYSYVKAHLRRKNPALTEPAELGAFPFRRRVRLSYAHLFLIIMLGGIAYLLMKAGNWFVVAGALVLFFGLIGLLLLLIRFVYRDRIRLAKLRKELAQHEAQEKARNEEEYLRREIMSYKNKG